MKVTFRKLGPWLVPSFAALLLAGCESYPRFEEAEGLSVNPPYSTHRTEKGHTWPDLAGAWVATNHYQRVGVFGERMPADVGIRGSYARFTSPMGSASFYTERFYGGRDHFAKAPRQHPHALGRVPVW
jgi:hypothetical protein